MTADEAPARLASGPVEPAQHDERRGARRRTALGMSLAAILALLSSAALLQRSEPFAMTGDNEMLPYPLLLDAYRQLRSGTVPIWTAGRWGGSPLLGDPIVGALYPPYHLAYALTDFPHARAFDVSLAAHLVLMATGMVLLLRLLGTRVSVAVTATLIFACSPTVVLIARSWIQLWSAMAYWPWLFAAAVQLSARPRARWAIVGTVSLAAQVLAGYQQFALYSGTTALLWVALRPGQDHRRRVAWAVLIGAGAVGLAAPQVLPGLDMAAESMRLGPSGSESMTLMSGFGLTPALWLDALRPAPFAIAPSKVAPVALLLALVSVCSRPRASFYFASVALLAAFLATIPNPVYEALHEIPPFSFFGAPMKFFYLALFALAVVAALGLEGLLAMPAARRRALLCLIGASAVLGLAARFPESWGYWAAAIAVLCLSPTAWLNPALLALSLASAGAFLTATQPWAAFDVAKVGPFGVLSKEAGRRAVTESNRSPGRFVALRGGIEQRIVGTNHGALWDIETLNGLGPLSQWRQFESTRKVQVTDLPRALRQWGADPVAVVAGGRAARHLIASGFHKGDPMGRLRIYSSPEMPPARYALVTEARAVEPEEAIRSARRGTALTDDSVLIETKSLEGGERGDPNGRVEVLKDSPPEIVLRVSVDRPTWLVARQPYYRNWKARIDAAATTVYPAGGFFLGILVDRGVHEVTLDYEERGLFIGVAIFAVTVVLLPFVFARLESPARRGTGTSA